VNKITASSELSSARTIIRLRRDRWPNGIKALDDAGFREASGPRYSQSRYEKNTSLSIGCDGNLSSFALKYCFFGTACPIASTFDPVL
jgi:hypothetical protein